jgi:hypothetical protein
MFLCSAALSSGAPKHVGSISKHFFLNFYQMSARVGLVVYNFSDHVLATDNIKQRAEFRLFSVVFLMSVTLNM